MMAYLDWSDAEDTRIEAQVAGEMEENPLAKEKGHEGDLAKGRKGQSGARVSICTLKMSM